MDIPDQSIASHARPRLLRPAVLTAVVFFTVSGGPYGLEPVLNQVGARLSFLLIFITPLLWSVPSILMVLELNGMMPKNGGYYQWVKIGLGQRWGFFEGWWSWLFMSVDLAIYPVLFIQYASFFVPDIAQHRYFVCLVIIWLGAGLNLLGVLPVGRSSVGFGMAVMIPFLLLFYLAFRDGISFTLDGSAMQRAPDFTALGLGLFAVMWNFLGWDNCSTFVEEVDRPVRSYLISIVAAFVLILVTYALAILAATSTGMDPASLESDGFPALGFHVGGNIVAGVLSLGGMASTLGLFVSILLSVSRLPKAMADDRFLPAFLRQVDARHNVPSLSIISCAVLVSIMVVWNFEDLLIIDVVLYGSALLLEFAALIALRRSHPDVQRPFRIPLSRAGLIMMSLCPAICFGVAIGAMAFSQSIHTNALLFSIAVAATAPFAWIVAKRD